jgi:hypothetical protein
VASVAGLVPDADAGNEPFSAIRSGRTPGVYGREVAFAEGGPVRQGPVGDVWPCQTPTAGGLFV